MISNGDSLPSRGPHPINLRFRGRFMEPGGFPEAGRLDRFRDYLRLLARVSSERARAAGWIPPTSCSRRSWRLSEARPVSGRDEGEQAAWLAESWHITWPMPSAPRAGRNATSPASGRWSEQMEESSARLGDWLAASTLAQRTRSAARAGNPAGRRARPAPRTSAQGTGLSLLAGLLPGRNQRLLDRSTTAVAGLLKRGLKHLREQLDA